MMTVCKRTFIMSVPPSINHSGQERRLSLRPLAPVSGRRTRHSRVKVERSTYANIRETLVLHILRSIDIPKVYHDRASHEALDSFKIESAKLLPLRYDHGRVRIFYAMVGSLAVGYVVQHLLGLLHAYRIEDANLNSHVL